MDPKAIQSFLTEMQHKHINGGCPPTYDEGDYDKALGCCQYMYWRLDGKTYRIGSIRLHPRIKAHPMLMKGVLWHEFAHHMEWQIDGTAGHGKKFNNYYEKELFYCILNLFALLFIKI